ncbi:MAG: hypothetical protein ACREIA_00995 [Opitutaceae bacterium]
MNTVAAPPDTSRFERFPGWEIVAAGLADIAAGRTTPSACAVWIAYPRLRRAGLVDGRYDTRRLDAAELELYRLLRSEGGDAYSRYNAFLRRLIRFEHALDRDSVRS